MAEQQVSTNKFSCSKWIVDTNGVSEGATHSTIAAALTSASSGDTIFIKPGTYTESLTLKAGVNLSAYMCDGLNPNVIIVGKITASYNGICALSGLTLNTNTDNAIAVSSANSSKLYVKGCTINANDATSISINAASFGVFFFECVLATASNNLNFDVVTSPGVDFRNCGITAGTGANTIAASSVNFFNCKIKFFSILTATTGAFTAYNCFFDNSAQNQTQFTLAGTGTGRVVSSQIFSGTASAISVGSGCTMNISSSTIDSSNATEITGLGTCVYSSVAMMTNSIIDATTQTPEYTHLGKYKASGQPAFLAYLTSSDTNATGNGTAFTVGGTTAFTEVFDQGADFNTNGTFTAPVSGRYLLQYSVRTTASTGATAVDFQLVTSGRTYRQNNNLSSLASQSWNTSVVANMVATDTATYTIKLTGIGADTATVVGGTPLDTYVSGQLLA